jgi:hypothetical protein
MIIQKCLVTLIFGVVLPYCKTLENKVFSCIYICEFKNVLFWQLKKQFLANVVFDTFCYNKTT